MVTGCVVALPDLLVDSGIDVSQTQDCIDAELVQVVDDCTERLGAFTDSIVENIVILLGDVDFKILEVDEISVERQEHEVANKVGAK